MLLLSLAQSVPDDPIGFWLRKLCLLSSVQSVPDDPILYYYTRVLRKQKRKTYAEATQSDLLEGKIVDISPDVGKVDAKIGKRSVDLEAIKKTLLSTEASKFSKVSNTPPDICVDTSLFHNCSNFVSGTTVSEPVMLSTQDMEVLEILEEFESNANDNFTGCEHKYNTDYSRMKGYFCSDTVFNLSNKALTEEEIKVLEKCLDFAPIQRKVNEPELRHDFENFCRRMRIKWHFRNETSDNFSERPAFSPKSSWKPPLGHPNLDVFLSQVENELFEITKEPTRYSNLSQEEWRSIRTLADDRSIVIKKADKGSGIAVWDRADYLREAEKQLSDKNVYQEVQFQKQMLSNLVDTSNKFFRGLKTKRFIAEKELKYFTYEYKKTCNFGKMYLSPKIHKRLSDLPGRPVILNCGMPTEKVSEFLDYQLKPVMQNGKSYIRDSGHSLERIKNINTLPENTMLVTADVVGLYTSIPHEAGISALKKALENRLVKKIPTENLIKMAELVLKNNLFEFNNVFQQISGTAIGTKFAPPYACIYMDGVEQEFLKTQELQPLLWLRFIDDVFFIWTHGKEELKKFMENFNNFTPNLRFTYEYSEESISFLDLIITVSEQKLKTTLHIKSTDRHQYLHYASSHPEHTKRSVVFNQTLRISRLCSEENDFKNYRSQMKSRFLKREYPEKLTVNKM